MNVGDRVRFERRGLGPWDERPAGTGMVIGFQGQLVIVEVDGMEKETLVGPASKFRRLADVRSQQPSER